MNTTTISTTHTLDPLGELGSLIAKKTPRRSSRLAAKEKVSYLYIDPYDSEDYPDDAECDDPNDQDYYPSQLEGAELDEELDQEILYYFKEIVSFPEF